MSFPLHTVATAPAASCEFLAATQRSFGMIPNLEATMATAPALLTAYSTAWDAFDTTSLTPVERQVVYQTANFENTCTYCVPWHTLLSEKVGMTPSDIAALRDGTPLSDPKLESLRAFARTLILQRGKATPADLAAFFDAGYTDQQALEVILGIAIKTMSNFTNALAGTPLDRVVASRAWQKPAIPMRSA